MTLLPTEMTDARVVAMCGVSGSGKTYFAKRLESSGFKRVSADGIAWARWGAELSEMPFERQKLAFAEVGVELVDRVERLLDNGDRVVVDSTMCKRTKRDALRAACRRHGVEPMFVYLDVPLDLLRRRLAGREGSGPDDQIVSEERLAGFFRNFERLTADENPFVVNID